MRKTVSVSVIVSGVSRGSHTDDCREPHRGKGCDGKGCGESDKPTEPIVIGRRQKER